MNETTKKPESRGDDSTPVQCEVCLKEVPASEARSAEGRDYVLHFCGTDCYEQWRAGAAEPEEGG